MALRPGEHFANGIAEGFGDVMHARVSLPKLIARMSQLVVHHGCNVRGNEFALPLLAMQHGALFLTTMNTAHHACWE